MESVAVLGRKCIVSWVNIGVRVQRGLNKQEMTQEGVARKERAKATLDDPPIVVWANGTPKFLAANHQWTMHTAGCNVLKSLYVQGMCMYIHMWVHVSYKICFCKAAEVKYVCYSTVKVKTAYEHKSLWWSSIKKLFQELCSTPWTKLHTVILSIVNRFHKISPE